MVLILWLIASLARNKINGTEIQIVLPSQMKSVLVGLQSLLSCQPLHFLHNIIGSNTWENEGTIRHSWKVLGHTLVDAISKHRSVQMCLNYLTATSGCARGLQSLVTWSPMASS